MRTTVTPQRPAPPRALTAPERAQVLALLHERGLKVGREHQRPLRPTRVSTAVMNVTPRVQAQADMPMGRVASDAEGSAVRAGIVHRAVSRREGGLIRERLALSLGVRTVVGHVQTRMRLRDTELDQQERDAGGRRRRTAIRLDRQLPDVMIPARQQIAISRSASGAALCCASIRPTTDRLKTSSTA